MSKNDEQDVQTDGGGACGERWVATEAEKARARKLFAHAQKAADTRNYDYAIELYVSGLAHWPDAVDEGLKMLRVVATARKLEGGRPPGFMTARKYPTGGKDVRKALNNALHLFGLNPSNIAYMEQLLQLAARARCDVMVAWIGPVLADAYTSAKKLPAGRYEAACAAMDAGAELAMQYENDSGAINILRANITTAQVWAHHYPESAEAGRAESNASGKLTILKGRFDRAEDFTESLKNAEDQQELHDRDKKAHAQDRAEALIERARREWEANRGVPNKLLTLVDLMTRTESDQREDEAIKLLEQEYATGRNYIFKHKADELQMRRLERRRRELVGKVKASPGDEAARQALDEHTRRQMEIEIGIFEERLRTYPTDLRVKFQLAVRFFRSGRYDEAIPLFQASRLDARARAQSRLYLGCCFYNKRFYDQAVEVLQRGVEETEGRSDALAFDLNYWLGRALEACRRGDEARRIYGRVIEMDYNYRDARARLERLVTAGEKPSNGGAA